MVLEWLKNPPFEPLQGADLTCVSLKMVLLALALAKRVGGIHVLSAHPSCVQFSVDDVRMIMKPNPAFVPKVVGSCSPIELAFTRGTVHSCAVASLCGVHLRG